MAEVMQVYLLYGSGLDQETKLELLTGIYELPEFKQGKDLDTVIEEKVEADFFLVDFEYGSPMLTLNLDPERPENFPDVPFMTVELDELDFMPSAFGEEHVDTAVADYVDFVVQIYEQSYDVGTPPRYVIGADPAQVDAFHDRFGWTVEPTRGGIMNGDVEQLFWLQVLPADTVENVGRERVLSAPAATVEELSDGAVLLVAYERPYPPGDPTKVADHLGVTALRYFT